MSLDSLKNKGLWCFVLIKFKLFEQVNSKSLNPSGVTSFKKGLAFARPFLITFFDTSLVPIDVENNAVFVHLCHFIL